MLFGAFSARSSVSRSFCPLSGARSSRWHYPLPQRLRRRYTTNVGSGVPTTLLERLILERIKATGPISFATYMQTCLTLPGHGYYTNSDNPVFGSKGDFITSPEISQVFGELVAVWFLSQWKNAGMPQAIRLIELGPGRGTLMDDILRVISQLTRQSKDTRIQGIHLVETSEPLRKVQGEKLHRYSSELHFHDSLRSISPSNAFSMIIAHEYFDALPFYLLQKTAEDEWREVMVSSTLDLHQNCARHPPSSKVADLPLDSEHHAQPQDPLFCRALSPGPTPGSIGAALLSPRFKNLPIGASLEVSTATHNQAWQLARLIGMPNTVEDPLHPVNGGGCGLIIDYGDTKAFGNSFRAFKDHKVVDVFKYPGKSDLTVNVDFALIQEAMIGEAATHGPITQADFLNRMGLPFRVHGLERKATTEERRNIIRSASERLVDPTGMGKEYKVMGFTSFQGESERMAEAYPF